MQEEAAKRGLGSIGVCDAAYPMTQNLTNDHSPNMDDLGLDVEWESAPPEYSAPRGLAGFEAARALSRRLRGTGAPRTKTGLVFWPEPLWRDAPGVAAALDATPVSLVARLLEKLPAEARAVPLDVESLFTEVAAVADERTGGDVAWVFDVDVLLAKLPSAERERFWEAAFDHLPHRARALLLALPLLERGTEHSLGPTRETLRRWRDSERLAVLASGHDAVSSARLQEE